MLCVTPEVLGLIPQCSAFFIYIPLLYVPYSGKLWRWKTLAAEHFGKFGKLLQNLPQSLTLKKLLQHTGSITNNVRDCNILDVIMKSLLVF